MFEEVDRTEMLNLPKFDPSEKGEKYREKISKQLDQMIDPFIIAELEAYFQGNNFEVLDSRGGGFDNFFYSFKLQYLDTQFSAVYSKQWIK